MFEARLLPIYRASPSPMLEPTHYTGGICLPGHRKLFVSADGLLYVCERVHNTGSEDDLYCIGNVEQGIDPEKVARLMEAFCRTAERDCCRCWAIRLCPLCFAPIVPDESQRMSLAEKRRACQASRIAVHDALRRFYSVLELDPTAFDFMERMELRYDSACQIGDSFEKWWNGSNINGQSLFYTGQSAYPC